MFKVSLTIPHLETASAKEAAILFLSSIRRDWSGGLQFDVTDNETGKVEHMRLSSAEIDTALRSL